MRRGSSSAALVSRQPCRSWRRVVPPSRDRGRGRGSSWPSRGARRARNRRWRAEYADRQSEIPRSIRVTSVDDDGNTGRAFDLRLALSQVEVNTHARRRRVPAGDSALGRAHHDRRAPRGGSARASRKWPVTCSVKVRAPAKINLSLRVLGVRADGYHELRTIFQSIALHDTLTIRAPARTLRAAAATTRRVPPIGRTWCGAPPSVPGRRQGAAATLRDVEIQLAKRIPLQAGLGGGSSDAAAALRALGSLWRVGRSNAARDGGFARRRRAVLSGGRHGARSGPRRSACTRSSIIRPAWVTLVLPRLRRQHGGGIPVVGRENPADLIRSALRPGQRL